MVFSSFEFLFRFLPAFLIIYFITPKKFRNAVLFLGSIAFYTYGEAQYVLLLLASVTVNYVIARSMYKTPEDGRGRRQAVLLILALCYDFGMLFFFKYSGLTTKLPLGISFYTFQIAAYVIDVYRGIVPAEKSYVNLGTYLTMFPQLIAGPIVLHNEVLPQFEDKNNWKVNSDNMAHGLYMFAAGLVKKAVIADTLSVSVAWGYSHLGNDLTSMEAILTMLAYTFQIYFDFSGYCDMATGLGYMFNIHIPMNFNSPYKALSIVDFWKRWHLTLTRFLRTYVYFPLGGSRKGTIRTYFNIIMVFLVSGLWHGANWTFIFWGFLHGIGNAVTRMFKKQWESMHEVIQWAATFLFVNITWIFFRADSISQAFTFIKRILGFKNLNVRGPFLQTFQLKEFHLIYSHIPVLNKVMASIRGVDALIMLTGMLFLCLNFKNNQEMKFRPTVSMAVFTVFCMVWGIFTLSGVSEFLYFNF